MHGLFAPEPFEKATQFRFFRGAGLTSGGTLNLLQFYRSKSRAQYPTKIIPIFIKYIIENPFAPNTALMLRLYCNIAF
jgi:hypothetical protein